MLSTAGGPGSSVLWLQGDNWIAVTQSNPRPLKSEDAQRSSTEADSGLGASITRPVSAAWPPWARCQGAHGLQENKHIRCRVTAGLSVWSVGGFSRKTERQSSKHARVNVHCQRCHHSLPSWGHAFMNTLGMTYCELGAEVLGTQQWGSP